MNVHSYPDTSEMTDEQLLEEHRKANQAGDSYWLECLEGELWDRDIEPEEAIQ